MVPPSAFFQDIDQAEYYAIINHLGNVISGSYGAPEFFVDPTELDNGNLLSEIARSSASPPTSLPTIRATAWISSASSPPAIPSKGSNCKTPLTLLGLLDLSF